MFFNKSMAKEINLSLTRLLSQRQILGTGNLPQDSAPVCINIDISPEMAAQSVQRNQTFVSRHRIGPQLHQLDLASK